VFLIDGRRTFRFLALLEEAERTPRGRRRNERQVLDALLKLWGGKRAEMEKELAERAGAGLTVSQAFTKWKKYARGEGLAETTIALHYERSLRDYFAANPDHPLGEITLTHLDRFKAHLRGKGLAPATINLRLSKVAAFLRWAQRRELLPAVPRIETVKEPRRLARTMTVRDIRRLIARLRKLIRDAKQDRQRYFYELHELMLVLILGTGMRRGEPYQCAWADVDLDGGVLRVLRPKEGHEKPVVLPELTVAYLRQRRAKYPHHVRLFDDGRGGSAYRDAHALTTAFRRHMKALGLTGKGIKPLHTHRAGFSTVGLDLLGLEPVAVQAQPGHAKLETTQRGYVSTMQTAKRRAVEIYEKRYLRPLFDRKASEGPNPKLKKPANSKR